MSKYDITFLILVAIIAINQFVIRSTLWHKRMWAFWIPQLINISAGSYAVLFGLPGVFGPIEVINWIIGGLFLYHFAQNQGRLNRHIREKKYEKRLQERARFEEDAQKNHDSNLPSTM